MSKFFDDCLDKLDCGVFIGDSLFEKDTTIEFYTYLHRWSNNLKNNTIIYHLENEVAKHFKKEKLSDNQSDLLKIKIQENFKSHNSMIEYIWQDQTDNYEDRKKGFEDRFKECLNSIINSKIIV